MRIFCPALLLVAVLRGQQAEVNQPPPMERVLKASLNVLEVPEAQDALEALETWLGKKLFIYDDRRGASYPPLPVVVYPPSLEAGESIVVDQGSVFIALSRLQQIASGAEFASVLSHALAHARLGHPARVAEKQAQLRLARATPHFPPQYVDESLRELVRAAEAEAVPQAREIYEATGCSRAECGLFDRTLAAFQRLFSQ